MRPDTFAIIALAMELRDAGDLQEAVWELQSGIEHAAQDDPYLERMRRELATLLQKLTTS